MKTKYLPVIIAIGTIELLQSTLFANPTPAPWPTFQTSNQLTHPTNAILTHKHPTPIQSTCANIFYTGKIFDQTAGMFLFKNRNYDQELLRWTTPDQSGFPDGPNNLSYAPCPTSELDAYGFWKVKITGRTETVSWQPNPISWDPSVDLGLHTRTLSGWAWIGSAIPVGQIADKVSVYGQVGTTYEDYNHVFNTTSTLERGSINPGFEVTVDSGGNLIVVATGQNMADFGDITILRNMNKSGSGKSVTISMSAAVLQNPSGLTGVGGNIGGAGANFTWSSPDHGMEGSVGSWSFEAVE